MPRSLLKKIASPVMVPFTKWYLRSQRTTNFRGNRLLVMPGVFHPGLFFSTATMAEFLEKQTLEETSLLEIGCGSGALSIIAAKKGAVTTASDISPGAIRCGELNAETNNVTVHFILSDLFNNIPSAIFRHILVNPPFYPGTPKTIAEHAWYCGGNYEYFHTLFSGAGAYMDDESCIWMVLSDDCNINMISQIARESGLSWEPVHTRRTWMESNHIYRLRKEAS